MVFEEGRGVRVVGRARREDHSFLLELAEEAVGAFPGKSGLVLVSPERVRVAYRKRGWGAGEPAPRAFCGGERVTKVRDLPQDAVLVQDSQEIQWILEHIGWPEAAEWYGCLFGELGEGEYRRVWGVERFAPYLEERAELLYEDGRRVE